jgi:Fungal specific transcription factor domain
MSDLACLYLQMPRKRGPKTYRGSRSGLREAVSGRVNSSVRLSTSAGSPSSLDTPYSINTEAAAPPWMMSNLPSITSQRSVNLNLSIQAIHQDLVLALSASVPNMSLEQICTSCLDCYVQEVFPLAPLVVESRLRVDSRLEAPLIVANVAASCFTGPSYGHITSVEDLARLRSYTLTTVICASAAFMLPPEHIPNGSHVGLLFFRASREMLKLFQDSDMDRPNCSSVLIRTMHAGVLHTDGKGRLYNQAFGEALGLVEQMRLYEERSFTGLDPVEAQSRRVAFWQLYIMDRYSAILEGRRMVLHEFSLGALITTRCHDGSDGRILDSGAEGSLAEFEEQLLAGFYACQQLWAAVSEVLLDLQTLSRFCQRAENASVLVEAQKMNLSGSYLTFLSVLDNLPIFLHSPEAILSANKTETETQRRRFWVQRANLLVTYHCLKMVLLQRFTDLGVVSLLGLSSDSAMLGLRKTEIAHDLISVTTNVPFDSLRANGEACVSTQYPVLHAPLGLVLTFDIKGRQDTTSRCDAPRSHAPDGHSTGCSSGQVTFSFAFGCARQTRFPCLR